MRKKIWLVCFVFLLTGCGLKSIKSLTYSECKNDKNLEFIADSVSGEGVYENARLAGADVVCYTSKPANSYTQCKTDKKSLKTICQEKHRSVVKFYRYKKAL
ncbi:MAG: hypothetical protein K5978_05300 [Campylobacter sp.]|nr:hypothetical protein [Campylobacter sp.]